MSPAHTRHIAIAVISILFVFALGLGCSATGGEGGSLPSPVPSSAPTVTLTSLSHPAVDFNATALAATVVAGGGYIVTSTPLPVWPTATLVPFDQANFLATINAQFAHATETAQALATPTPTPTRTPPPPRILPPAGGSAPGDP